MEVRLDKGAEELEDQVTYLYKYELHCSVNAPLTMKIAFDLAVAVTVMVAREATTSLVYSFAN